MFFRLEQTLIFLFEEGFLPPHLTKSDSHQKLIIHLIRLGRFDRRLKVVSLVKEP